MLAVEIGPYTRGQNDDGLGPNEFALVSANPWNDWTKMSGNPLEYLLVDDDSERRARWSHDEFASPVALVGGNESAEEQRAILACPAR
jgi:hypothetical protein